MKLNIASDKREDFIATNIVWDNIRQLIHQNNAWENIILVLAILKQIKDTHSSINVKQAANQSIYNIYKWILAPQDAYKNTTGIYRIGTFLKYHIINNNTRLFEDSLIFNFQWLYL